MSFIESLKFFKRRILWKVFLFKNQLPQELKQGDWSLGIDDFEVIFKKIRSLKNRDRITLVELGAGVSTIILACFMAKLNMKYSIVSFEGDSSWVERVEEWVNRYHLNKEINLYHIPYEQYADCIWFKKDRIKEIINGQSIDILLVDAPPGVLCPVSRKSAIPFFLPWLHNDSTVFLHDTKRKDELDIIQAWDTYFNSKTTYTLRGITAFRHRH